MPNVINGTSTGSGGLISSGDDSGILNIQTNETTAITVDASQNVSTTNGATIQGLTVGRGAGAVANNTAVGASALAANTTGLRNTAIGGSALLSNTTGENTAVGFSAGANITTGTANAFVGGGLFGIALASGNNTTTGSYNTGLGHGALGSNTTASNNTAVGYQAGYSNTTGTQNQAFGYRSLYSNTTGSNNTAIGFQAGNLTTSSANTFIGAGPNGGSGELMTTGGKNSILGAYNGNQGGLDIRTSSNNIVLSDGDGNPRFYDRNGTTYSPSIYAIATSGGSTVSIGGDASMFRNTSSLRYKKNVMDTSRGLSDVMKLRAVQYESIAPQEAGKVFGGLIAEELHDSGLTEFVEYDLEGRPDAVHYANMVSLAFKAIQELKAEFDAYKASHP